MRGGAVLDVLIPGGLGHRAGARTGVTGSTTLVTPGAEQALRRREVVEISVVGHDGSVPRPNLLGALVIKAAAYSVKLDLNRDRHLTDLAVLASMIGRNSLAGITKTDKQYLRPAVAAMTSDRPLWIDIADAERGIEILDGLLNH